MLQNIYATYTSIHALITYLKKLDKSKLINIKNNHQNKPMKFCSAFCFYLCKIASAGKFSDKGGGMG